MNTVLAGISTYRGAVAAGEKVYFLNKACPKGHNDLRYTSNRNCLACVALRSRQWYSDPVNADRVTAKNKHWWVTRKDEEFVRNREWRIANAERVKETTRAWRAKNKERFKEKGLEWARANKPRKSAYLNAYRARKRNNGGAHTFLDVEALLVAQRDRCVACRKTLSGKYHVDHIIALKNCGSNDRQNLQILCPSCNSTKSARHPIEFMQSMGWLL